MCRAIKLKLQIDRNKTAIGLYLLRALKADGKTEMKYLFVRKG